MKPIWIILAIIYAISPIDIIPEALLGGWGWLEDFVILFFLWNYLRGGGNPLGMFRYGRRPFGRSGNTGTGANPSGSGTETGARPDATRASQNPYTVLGVSEKRSPEEIKVAFREQAAKYHPDKFQHLGDEFQKLADIRYKEIEEAYRRLKESDPKM